MREPTVDGEARPEGAELLAAISGSVLGIAREECDGGLMKVKTYIYDDIVVVAVRRSGCARSERTSIAGGESGRVIAMAGRLKDAIEEHTDRRVVALFSRDHVDPDVAVEVFLVDEPLAAAGAVEITEPP
jgi:hypothetical protein